MKQQHDNVAAISEATVKSLQNQLATMEKTRAEEVADLKQVHATATEINDSSIKSLQDQLATMEKTKAEDLAKLEEEYATATKTNESTIKSLQDQLKALAKSTADEITTLRASLEPANAAKTSELQAAEYRAERMKQIIQSMEADEREYEQEHARVVEQLQGEISLGSQKLTETSQRMSVLGTQVQKLEKTVLEREVELAELRKVQQGDKSMTNGDKATTPKKSSKSKTSAKVDGHIAGIQEQLKQLDEINDEMLQDHQEMARTLNKASEKTVMKDADRSKKKKKKSKEAVVSAQ